MAREIFISYSRYDKDLVHPFVEQINQALGIDCWIDLKGIEGGDEFEEVIIKAIDECKIVLFMLSDNSLESPWTKREVYYAERRGKRIIPVVIDGKGLRGWFDFHFGNINFIDILSEEEKQKLISNLRGWLGVEETWRKAEEDEYQRKLKELENIELEPFEKDGKWGFDDEEGNVVIPCKWKYAWYFSEGLAAVQDDNGKWGYIDKMGKVVIPCKWNGADSFSEGTGSFSEGLAALMDDNRKYGFIDKTGNVVIPCKWNGVGRFSEGLAVVKDGKRKWGYIDKTGKVVIPCKWNGGSSFSEGWARVQDDNRKWWKIDKTGKIVE